MHKQLGRRTSVMAFSSAFFIGYVYLFYLNLTSGFIKKVEAACPMGQYSKNGKTCTTTNALSDTSGDTLLRTSISTTISVVVAILLAGSILVIIYSGYEYIVSGIQSDKAERAKSRMIPTFLAIVILLSVFSVYRLLASFVF